MAWGTFAGIVRFDGAPIDRDIEGRLARAVTGPRTGQSETFRTGGALFVQQMAVPVNSRAAAHRIFAANSGRGLFAASARLDNRAELATALGIPPHKHWSDAALLMQMLERRGDQGVARCLGAFAFARWEADARRLTLGRDCLGNRTLLFHHAGRFAVFSNTLGVLLSLPDVPREIDEAALASLMVLNPRNPRRTLYRGIERTPSRTLVTIDAAGINHRHYWTPDLDAPPPYQRDEDYVERARELFDQAVVAATAGSTDFAIATSGGLDSSAIAATAARLGCAKRITCYTLVNPPDVQIDVGPDQYADERDKVAALARMYPAIDLHLLAPEGLHPIVEDETRHFALANLPVLGPTALGLTAFLSDAVSAAGHPLLLVGARGNFGLTWSGRFSLLSLLAGGEWSTFAREFGAVAHRNKRGLARTFSSDILWPGAPPGLRRLAHRLRGRDPDDVARYSAINPEFIAEFDLARQWREQGFDPRFQYSGWQPARYRIQYLFDNHQAHRDSMYWLDDASGFDIRDPHADRRLLEFALSVPEPLYRRNGVPRSFARAVFADRLPREILDEQRRGAGVGGGAWFRRLSLRRQAIGVEIERLEGSAMARRLIDLPRLKRLVDQWPKDEHAAQHCRMDYQLALTRGIHIGRFIRWVEGGNA